VILAPIEVCSHYEELLASLERIDARMRWANASNVGRGVTWAVRGAKSIGPHTAFVFITDGQESPPLRANDTPPMVDVTPGEVKGWLVGVGGDVPAATAKPRATGSPRTWCRAPPSAARRTTSICPSCAKTICERWPSWSAWTTCA
jgi:mxaL protein